MNGEATVSWILYMDSSSEPTYQIDPSTLPEALTVVQYAVGIEQVVNWIFKGNPYRNHWNPHPPHADLSWLRRNKTTKISAGASSIEMNESLEQWSWTRVLSRGIERNAPSRSVQYGFERGIEQNVHDHCSIPKYLDSQPHGKWLPSSSIRSVGGSAPLENHNS